MKKGLITFSLLTASLLQADMFTAMPGAKARGMGGAYTAISSNDTASYYNPAGVASSKGEKFAYWTAAYNMQHNAQIDSMNEAMDLTSATNEFYIGLGMNAGEMGLSYNHVTVTTPTTDPTKLISLGLSHIGLGYEVTEGFSVGAVMVSTAFSDLFNIGDTNAKAADSLMTANIGVMLDLPIESTSFNVALGASHRFGATTEIEEDYTTLYESGLPQKTTLGVAMDYFMTDYAVTVSADYGMLDYSEATKDLYSDGTTMAFGAELSIIDWMSMVRAGWSTSELDSANPNFTVKEGTLAGGLGILLDNGMILEATVEERTFEWRNLGSENATLIYASITQQLK